MGSGILVKWPFDSGGQQVNREAVAVDVNCKS